MLCCVSRKLVNRPEFKNPPSVSVSRSVSLTNTLLLLSSSQTNKSSSSSSSSFINDNSGGGGGGGDDDDNNPYYKSESKDEPAALLPCSICGRTFKLQSLEKHTIICEKTVTKKRKPFDSSKQRIRGTELEEFLPKESTKKRMNDDKYKTSESWKETHNDFIKTIRAAKVDTNNDMKIHRQTVSSSTTTPTTSGPPTRANDKGTCPTCNRQFGIKAYDRHVAWCKDRVTHVPSNAMTNVAKERLDARMKYRAPVLKNRRMTNREKYAPSSTTTTTAIMNNNNNKNSSPGSIKPNESISLPNSCKIISSSSSNGYKPAVVRKFSQGKNEGIVPSGPLKSRPSDRSFIREIEDLQTTRNQCPLLQSSHSSKIINNNSINISINSYESSTNEWEIRGRSMSSIIKSQKQLNIVSSRSRGNPKLNDVTVNTDVIGVMKVQPCTIHKEKQQQPQIEYKKIHHDTTKKCIKSNDDWIRNCDKLDETYLIKENNNNNVYLVKLTNNDTEEKVDVESLREFVIDISRTSTPVAFDDKDDKNDKDDDHVGGGGDNKEALKFQQLISVNQQNDNDDKKLNNEIEPLNLTVNNNNSFKIVEKNINNNNNNNNNNNGNSINITTDSLDSDRSHDIYLRKKLRKKMCYLRNSTDSLVSSIEAMPLLIKNKKQVNNKPCAIENNIVQQHHRNKKSNRLTYLEQAIRNSKGRVYQAHRRMDLLKIDNNKNPKIPCVLPPIKKIPGKRNSVTSCRPAWSNYVRRHPDFNLVLKGRTGMTQDYDPFLQAERQMNDLLSDTCSDDQLFPKFTKSQNTNNNNINNINSNSNLSAFVKYPNQITLNSNDTDKRTSSTAKLTPPPPPPPQPTTTTTTDFDELSIDFSSDSTENNSISREILNDFEPTRHKTMINNNNNNNNLPILGRKMIIDKSKALGKIIIDNSNDTIDIINLTKNNSITDRNNKSAKLSRSNVNRSNSVRALSAPKIPERNNSIVSSVNKASSRSISSSPSSSSLSTLDFNKNDKNNYLNNLNSSNLSLNSIVSSGVVGVGSVGSVKRSNSLFEDLVCSFEDNVSGSYSSLRSFLKTDSLSSSSPVQSSIRPRNGQISDEDLSSPDSYNKKEHGKISVDSAYSSLNRKNYNCKLDEKKHQEQDDIMSKMSKFCHQCGTKFPETAKFCCECGIRRLAI